MQTPQALQRRVAKLEAIAKAAQPLLVWVRCFSGEAVRVTGPDSAEWHRQSGETPEAFSLRVQADARVAMRRCANPPAVWTLHERHTATDRPFDKKELFA